MSKLQNKFSNKTIIWTAWDKLEVKIKEISCGNSFSWHSCAEIFSSLCDSRFDCKRNHCSSKTAVNRSVSLQFVYFSLSESLVNYGLESDLCFMLDLNYEKNRYIYNLFKNSRLYLALAGQPHNHKICCLVNLLCKFWTFGLVLLWTQIVIKKLFYLINSPQIFNVAIVSMAIRVLEFSNGEYKIRKIFA